MPNRPYWSESKVMDTLQCFSGTEDTYMALIYNEGAPPKRLLSEEDLFYITEPSNYSIYPVSKIISLRGLIRQSI